MAVEECSLLWKGLPLIEVTVTWLTTFSLIGKINEVSGVCTRSLSCQRRLPSFTKDGAALHRWLWNHETEICGDAAVDKPFSLFLKVTVGSRVDRKSECSIRHKNTAHGGQRPCFPLCSITTINIWELRRAAGFLGMLSRSRSWVFFVIFILLASSALDSSNMKPCCWIRRSLWFSIILLKYEGLPTGWSTRCSKTCTNGSALTEPVQMCRLSDPQALMLMLNEPSLDHVYDFFSASCSPVQSSWARALISSHNHVSFYCSAAWRLQHHGHPALIISLFSSDDVMNYVEGHYSEIVP